MPGASVVPTPLTTLLSWVWVALTIEIDNGFEAASSQRVGRHFRISLPMWTNGLRLVDDGGITVAELRSLSRAACNLGGLERWASHGPAPGRLARRQLMRTDPSGCRRCAHTPGTLPLGGVTGPTNEEISL